MTVLDAIILGIVEGITEYLPISSTGHLILAAELLGLGDTTESKRAIDAFTIIIQGGAILAVLGLYFRRVMQMIRGLLGRDRLGRRLLINLFVAFLPAAMIGPFLDDWIEQHLFSTWPVIIALAFWGAIMLLVGPWQKKFFHPRDNPEDDPHDAHEFVDIEHLTWRRALIIGLLQCIAMWPGTSRSLMTILGGMLVGLRPKHAAEFSFLLGLPTLGGACVYKVGKIFLRGETEVFAALGGPVPIIVGIITATIAAALAVKWLVGYLSKHGVSIFGWYRIALAAIFAALILGGVIDPITPESEAETASAVAE